MVNAVSIDPSKTRSTIMEQILFPSEAVRLLVLTDST
jgi:hypothetical protein